MTEAMEMQQTIDQLNGQMTDMHKTIDRLSGQMTELDTQKNKMQETINIQQQIMDREQSINDTEKAIMNKDIVKLVEWNKEIKSALLKLTEKNELMTEKQFQILVQDINRRPSGLRPPGIPEDGSDDNPSDPNKLRL